MRGPLPASPANIELAHQVLADEWRERAQLLGRPDPIDLRGACKFASLFAQALFIPLAERMADPLAGLRGNREHQWLELDGQIVDLTDAAGLTRPYAYRHDPTFWGNLEHRASLDTCRPRVAGWLRHFDA